MNPSIIREILKVTGAARRDVDGRRLRPAAETFPVEAIREACDRVLSERAAGRAAVMPPARASAPLREWVAAHLGGWG